MTRSACLTACLYLRPSVSNCNIKSIEVFVYHLHHKNGRDLDHILDQPTNKGIVWYCTVPCIYIPETCLGLTIKHITHEQATQRSRQQLQHTVLVAQTEFLTEVLLWKALTAGITGTRMEARCIGSSGIDVSIYSTKHQTRSPTKSQSSMKPKHTSVLLNFHTMFWPWSNIYWYPVEDWALCQLVISYLPFLFFCLRDEVASCWLLPCSGISKGSPCAKS